jgi:hypothetical protein
MPTFTHQGKELTAGQALDVWLAHAKQQGSKNMHLDVHLFADAVEGYTTPLRCLKPAGIEIQFGEQK